MVFSHFKMRCFLSFIFALLISVVNGSSKCSSYDFPCEDGECVDAGLWCDSHKDCTDGSDEKYCKKTSYFKGNPNKCPSNYFKCNDGPCIPEIGRCDGYESCEDSSDEKDCEQSPSPKSVDTSSSTKSTTLVLEKTTSAATVSKTTIRTTQQPRPKVESQSTPFSYAPDAMQHSVEIVYSDFQHSDYSHQLENARNWLLSQRRSDFGWGDETPRALIALYLSDVKRSIKNETDMLMVKQLEVQLSLDMSRNGTKNMKPTDVALYINALMASCKDPHNFYGENLVRTLRNGVDVAHREGTFINPSVYLTLCINNETNYEDARKLHEVFLSRNAGIGRIDIQALALLAITCIQRNTNFLTSAMYDGLRKQFIQKANVGLPGNVYEASLLVQALEEMKVTLPGLLEFILKQQQEDGSFGSILATYLALPVLAGRSFLQMNQHCSQSFSTDLAPIEVLKNSKRRKIFVQYSLNYGYPPEIKQTIQMQVAEGINFLDVMRLAQEINPKFRFMLDGNREAPVVYSIGGVPNDAEKGLFWTLLSTTNGRGNDAGRLTPYSGNIKQLIPHAGDEFLFWLKSI